MKLPIFLLFILIGLFGCATSNTERAMKMAGNMEPQKCSFTDRDGNLQQYEGPICDNIARAQLMNACSEVNESQQGMCIMAIAFTNMNDNSSKQSDLVRLAIAGMQADAQINTAWISQIPIIGTLASVRYNYKSDKAMFEAFETGMSSPGVMNITQSNDGGDGEGSGRGGDGDLLVFPGNDSQWINRSDGSVTSEGRNGNFMGLNEPDSSFDPSTANNNNASGAKNENAPGVSNSDDDGGQSLIPNI